MNPVFFPTHDDFRAWLEKHHDKSLELWVGYYKRLTGKPSITWPESVDVALCFGWIDGLRKTIDESSYKIRFTPRRPGSNWSSVNVKRVGELSKLGLMRPEGLKAFERRKENRTYSYEQRNTAKLSARWEKKLRANKKAWDFFQAQAPSYRKTCIYWIMLAKQEETRERRLDRLIQHSMKAQRIGPVKGS